MAHRLVVRRQTVDDIAQGISYVAIYEPHNARPTLWWYDEHEIAETFPIVRVYNTRWKARTYRLREVLCEAQGEWRATLEESN